MMNTKAFSILIEEIVIEKRLSYMDAIVHYCDNNEMEIESAAKLVNSKIKESIKQNKFSPGKHIPIKSYEYFLSNIPEVIVLFAWNHAKEIIENLKNIHRPVVLILNKIDLINKKDLLPLISEFQSLFKFEKIFMLSALKSKGIKDFLDWITKQMPVGPFLYPIEDITDTNLRYLASEILREKLLLNMHQEIPYNLIVSTETWKEKKDNNLEIHQNIFVSKTSHKAMILGKSGQNIKRIGILARKEMEKVFNKRIHLYTRVKIQENCLTNINLLKSSGLNIDA